jgi:hypothetical protein
MPSITKLFSSISSSSKKDPQSPLLPAATNTTVKFDEYHTKECNKPSKNRPIVITVAVESPPLVLFGHPSISSGAFFSGNFILDILLDEKNKNDQLEPMISVSKLSNNQISNDYIIMKDVILYLIQIVQYSKPFIPNSSTIQSCHKCTNKIIELARWDILSKKTAFAKGSSHSCPFSHIIPGNVPPTSILSNSETSITYELICKATYIDPITNNEKLINLSQPIKIQRSIVREQDRTSTRIFPPTDVTSTAVIPNVVYPRSEFPIEIRMDHVSTPKRRWRMRKLNWRLEECITMKTNNCSNHESKFIDVYESTKKQKRSVKLNKNSGGIGHACVNYYFETPKRQMNNNNSSIAPPNVVDIHPNDDRNELQQQQQNDLLAPTASNWSLNASPISSSNNNISNESNSLDQVLSSNVTPIQSSNIQSTSLLSNPNEVVMPVLSSSSSLSIKKPEMFIEEIRTISSGELKSGWKSDFSGHGRIELVVKVSLKNLISMGINNTIAYKSMINSQTCNTQFAEIYKDSNSGCNCSIDIEDPELGIYVTHNLILEVVVAEELMQSSLAHSNQSAVPERFKNQATHVSANSTAAIVTGNISQSRMRPVNSNSNLNSNSNSSAASFSSTSSRGERLERPERRIALTEDDFPDERVGPDPINGNKSDSYNNLQGVPTGVARVLRMQFKVILCERSGLGVAWDDEVPPTYHTVGALSPPNYVQAKDDVLVPSLKDLVIPLKDNISDN